MADTDFTADPSRRAPYADALERHADGHPISLLVPGHGASADGISAGLAAFVGERPLQLDVTPLLDGIDLGAGSPRAQAEQLAAEAWGARRTWFLTNGSTQGNRTAAMAIGQLGGDILLQRSVHSSIVDGLVLSGMRPGFILPEIDYRNGAAHNVTPEAVREALATHDGDVKAVYIVSPSYFGAVADVPAIAEIVHAAGAALIVDGAWGPHFGFHPDLPESPLRQGADLSIMSTHKLTGSLTQSALLHLGDTALADTLEPVIERAFRMTSSTSESSLLIGSIDINRRDLQHGAEHIEASLAALSAFSERVREHGRFGLLVDTFDRFPSIVQSDPLRLPIDISSTGLDGHTVRIRLMREHNIWVEMATRTTIVPMVGLGKRPQLDPLLDALDRLADENAGSPGSIDDALRLPAPGALRMLPREAFLGDTELVSAAAAIGRISADSLAAYPPGIPNMLPGEEITAETVAFLQAIAHSAHGYVRGAIDAGLTRFRVVAQ
ncbi:aminotransferase class V-fold PLP-dependent enzyme [Leucobacter zeae]|nr:aminotransferase class V-fold PLP-dependent enzyme [Leucobacter zeae]